MSLGIFLSDAGKEQKPHFPEEQGVWEFGEEDYALYALLCDPIYCAELLCEDPTNREYGGCYQVRDYQFPLNRGTGFNYELYPCARTVGKTESIKNRAMTHPFKRMGENLLVTTPELIHLLPLTDAIEDRIESCRLTREFLDTEGGRTGFTHRPFGVDFKDSTKIVGRIPRQSGVGVKGQHQPDLLVDEGQDYPEAGWTEVHETVMKDHVDQDGKPDFSYMIYGVHSGARDTGFHGRATKGGFSVVQITALQRPGWGKNEKEAAKAAYGGTSAPDYRRNILGEPGAAASPLFVTARLVACMDQDRDSEYNKLGYVHQEIRVEQFDELMMPIAEVLDLPRGLKRVWGGADLGLTNAPTVICLFNEHKVKGETRLELFRRIHLERMRVKTIRHAFYAIFNAYGDALQGFGVDETGLGFPIFQEIEDDENKPALMDERFRGYFFNSKVAVGVEKGLLTQDAAGNWRDQYGAAVEVRTNPFTNEEEYVVRMPMIEASTRYLREFVDDTFFRLPFDPAVIGDMQGETQQRVKRIQGLKQKPNAFHILDSMRAMAMVYKALGEEGVEAQLATPPPASSFGNGDMRVLVTGGAGFIGSHFVDLLLLKGHEVTVLDKLTYAGRRENLNERAIHELWHADICSTSYVLQAMRNADAVVNFAAETHVDRSIASSGAFVNTNVLGTHMLLEHARLKGIRYVQISTDEVYGSIITGSFTEHSPLSASSPYSATKAAADLLVQSYHHTHGMDALIVRGSNNYGTRQFPEKLIPLAISKALAGENLPMYGDGRQVRNWIHVEDFARGVYHVLLHGAAGEVYNCGGPSEHTNRDVLTMILQFTGSKAKIESVTDRPGHDWRYSLNSHKLIATGWHPKIEFEDGLWRTVRWAESAA